MYEKCSQVLTAALAEGIGHSTLRYQRRRACDEAVRQRLRELAAQRAGASAIGGWAGCWRARARS
jgi:hypothetical protein